MKNTINKHLKGRAFCAVFALAAVCAGTKAIAAVSGSGTAADPITGTAKAGDSFGTDVYVKNLSKTDGAEIVLKRILEPKTYTVVLDSGEGRFADGSTQKEITVGYGDNLKELIDEALEEPPVSDGKTFSGWYIEGNRESKTDENGYSIGGDRGNNLIGDDTLYLIDTDDQEDSGGADLSDGKVVIKAVWLDPYIEPEDGYEADDPVITDDGTAGSWDSASSSGNLIEYLDAFPLKSDYSLAHGKTGYPYGRAAFNAKTGYASGYSWYYKKKDEADYTLLDETGSELVLTKLTREDNEAAVRCVVDIGDAGDTLTYEKKLTVYYLPDPKGINVTVDGTQADVSEADKEDFAGLFEEGEEEESTEDGSV